jgi:3-hydroxyisobutyrate dehydrogenase
VTEIGFIGLGAMGAPMAGHLVAQGHSVRVFNRSARKAVAWADRHAGRMCESVAVAADGAAFVVACVGNDQDVRETFELAAPVMAAGGCFVDHTTTSAVLARELAAQADRYGVAFVDAPVSGGQAGAVAGQLTVMAGGTAQALEQARPIMMAYAKAVTHMGPAGSGQLAKMVNQICIAGVVQGLAEGLAFAERAGLNGEAVIGAISKGAAQSWQMENRWRTMLEGRYDFGFAVDWMRKDLGLVLDEARRNGAQAPLTALVDQFYADLQAQGHARSDTSSLMERLRRPR